jgi:hypothetical protein
MIEAIMKIGDFVSGMDGKGGLLSILFGMIIIIPRTGLLSLPRLLSILFGMILAYDFRVLI